MPQKPTIGRVVTYTHEKDSVCYANGVKQSPATISQVRGEFIDLHVLVPTGTDVMTSVPYNADGAFGTWAWPKREE